jgi:WD40 repeat protein
MDESGVILATVNDELVFRQHIIGEEGTTFGVHRDVRFLRASERHGVIVTASKSGKFKLWDYRTKTLTKTVNTAFQPIKEVVIKSPEEIIVLARDDLILIDFKYDRSMLIVERPENASLPGKEEWKPLSHPLTKPTLESVSEKNEFQALTSMIDLETEQQILESGKKYDELNVKSGKKARRSSITRQTFLHSLHELKRKVTSRILYLDTNSTLVWAKDKEIHSINFSRWRFTGVISAVDSITYISTNNDESFVFCGMKSGTIKVYDAQDLTEQGELIGHTNQITSIINSKGKHRLVFSAAKDDTVRVWHLGLGEEIGQLLQDEAFTAQMQQLEMRRMSTDFDAGLSTKIREMTRLKNSKNRISDLNLSMDEEYLYCIFNDSIYRWSILSHYKEFDYVDPNPHLNKGVLGHQRPDNLYVPCDQKIQRVDVVKRTLEMESPPLSDEIVCIAVSRQEEKLVAGLGNGFIAILRTKDLSVNFEVELTQEPIEHIEFFKETYVVASAGDGGVYVYDLVFQRKYHLMRHLQKVTALFLSETQEYLFTAGHDLLIRKFDLRPLSFRESPVEEFYFPIELPAHAMSIDLKRNLLYYSQRDMIHVFDIVERETVAELSPLRLGEAQEKLRERSGINSETNQRMTYNPEETVAEFMSWATREEFTVKAIFQLWEFNIVVIVRANGNVSCWDAATHVAILDFFLSDKQDRSDRIERAFKPHTGNLFFCFNDKNAMECVNVFRINFFDCCYIQTFSERMSEEDFIKKLKAFYELAKDSPFIEKILHPLYLAFLLNKHQAIGYILKTWGYPVLNSFQTSPLILALEGRHVNFAESLFRELAAYKGPLTFRYWEIKCMLEHDFKFVKRLLIKVCEKIESYTNADEKIKKYNQLKNPQDTFLSFSGHFTKKNFENFLEGSIPDFVQPPEEEVRRSITFGGERRRAVSQGRDDEEEEGLLRKSSFSDIRSVHEDADPAEGDQHLILEDSAGPTPSNGKSHNNTYTEVFRINGFYNFERGSDDTLNFLYRYGTSNVDEFVLSNWRHLIAYKWKAVENPFRLMAILYFTFLFSFNLLLMHPHEITWLITTAVALGILVLYELVPMLAYKQYYFSDPLNYIDLVLYGCTVWTLVWIRFQPDPLDLRFQGLQVATDILGFYKGIGYLHIFKSLRSMTFMINNLISESRDVLVMIIYLTLALTVLLNVVMYDNGFYGNIIWVVFMSYCNFPPDYNMPYIKLFVIVCTMFCLTLIMINFMIAKMANIYSSLEQKQVAANLKQMAMTIFDFEIWFRIFSRRKSDRKYMTYYIMKANEPDYTVEELQDDDEDVSGVAGFKEEVNLILEQLERMEMRSKGLLDLKKEVTKLQSQTRLTSTSQDVKSINEALTKIVGTEKTKS